MKPSVPVLSLCVSAPFRGMEMISIFSWGWVSNPPPPTTTSSFNTRNAPKCTFSLSCQFPKLKEWWLSSQPKLTWPLSEAGEYFLVIKAFLPLPLGGATIKKAVNFPKRPKNPGKKRRDSQASDLHPHPGPPCALPTARHHTEL